MTTKKTGFIVYAICCLCFVITSPVQAVTNLLVNGDFETGNTSNWTVTNDIDWAGFFSHWLDGGCVAPGWCDNCDLNFSGTVNFGDFAILADAWLNSTDNISVVTPPGDNESSYGIQIEPGSPGSPGLRQQSTTNFSPETLYQFSLKCLMTDNTAAQTKTVVLDPVADTYIDSGNPTTIYSTEIYTDCYNWNNGSGGRWMKMPYYQYQLPNDFSSAISAKFRYNVTSSNCGGGNYLYMVKKSAAQGNANNFTWNNAPGNNPADTITFAANRTHADSFYTGDYMSYTWQQVGQNLISVNGVNGATISELNSTEAGNKALFFACYYYSYASSIYYNRFASIEDTNPAHPAVQLELTYQTSQVSIPLEMAIGYMDGENFVTVSTTTFDVPGDPKTQWEDRLVEYRTAASGIELGKAIVVRIINKSNRDIYMDNCELFTPNLYTSYHGKFEGLHKSTPEFDVSYDSNYISIWHAPDNDANWGGTYPMKDAEGNIYIGYWTNVSVPRNHMARSPDGGNTWYECTAPYENGLTTPFMCSAYGLERILWGVGSYPQYNYYADVNNTELVWHRSYSELEPPSPYYPDDGEPATNSTRIPRNQRIIAAQEHDIYNTKAPGFIYTDDCAQNWRIDFNLPPHPTITGWRRPTAILSPDGLQVMIISGVDYYGPYYGIFGGRDSNDGVRQVAHMWLSKNGLCTSWTSPQPISSAAGGDGHYWNYDKKSGRLVINLRDITTSYEHAYDSYMDSICWVGTWDDLIYGRDGQYRVKVFDDPMPPLDWYSGMTCYDGDADDDTVFVSFYHQKMCRFTLPQMDAMLPGGLKLHLPLDESTGTSAEDTALYSKVGPNLIAAVNGGTTWTTGVPGLGNALSFDGIDDYVQLDTNGQFKYLDSNTGSFTVSFWMKTSNPGQSYKHVIAKGSRQAADSGWAAYLNGGNMNFRVCDAIGTSQIIYAAVPTDNLWHHYALVINSGTNQLLGYLDGNPSAFTGSSIASIGAIVSSENLHLGCSSNAGVEADYFAGSVDDVKILDRVITANEAKGLARNMVVHYAMDEGSFAVLDDSALMDKPYSGTWLCAGWQKPTWDIGHSGNCVRFFDSLSQFAVREKDTRDSGLTSLDPQTDSFSVALWYKLYPGETAASLAGKGCNTSINEAGWRIYVSSGYLYVRVANGSTSTYQRITAPSQNVWHHVVMVVDRATNTLYGYSDGIPMSTGANISGITNINNSQLFFMAGRPIDTSTKPYTCSDRLNGWLDDIKIYRKALSSSEINAVYGE